MVTADPTWNQFLSSADTYAVIALVPAAASHCRTSFSQAGRPVTRPETVVVLADKLERERHSAFLYSLMSIDACAAPGCRPDRTIKPASGNHPPLFVMLVI